MVIVDDVSTQSEFFSASALCYFTIPHDSRFHLFSFPRFPPFPRFFLPLLPPLPISFCLHLTLSYSSFLSFPSLTLPHSHPTTPHPTPPILPNCFSHLNAVLRSFLILFYPNFYYTVLSTLTITIFTTDQTYQICFINALVDMPVKHRWNGHFSISYHGIRNAYKRRKIAT